MPPALARFARAAQPALYRAQHAVVRQTARGFAGSAWRLRAWRERGSGATALSSHGPAPATSRWRKHAGAAAAVARPSAHARHGARHNPAKGAAQLPRGCSATVAAAKPLLAYASSKGDARGGRACRPVAALLRAHKFASAPSVVVPLHAVGCACACRASASARRHTGAQCAGVRLGACQKRGSAPRRRVRATVPLHPLHGPQR